MKFVFLIAAANAIKPRRLNTNNAEFVDDQMIQFSGDEYNEERWNDELAKINNVTQYGFNDYLNTGKYESIAQTWVNATTEFKAIMRSLDQNEKDAELQLETDSKKSEEMQAEFN
jgi:hypothetical protein